MLEAQALWNEYDVLLGEYYALSMEYESCECGGSLASVDMPKRGTSDEPPAKLRARALKMREDGRKKRSEARKMRQKAIRNAAQKKT